MSKSKQITPAQKQDMRRSVEKAEAAVCVDEALSGLPSDYLLSEDAQDAKLALHNLRYTQERDIRSQEWLEILVKAARCNDFNFFQQLGKILGEEPLPPDQRIRSKGRLAWFLIRHWDKAVDGIPPLYEVSPPDLAEICGTCLNNAAITEEMVIKTRQRLKLMPFKGSKRKLKRVKGELMFRQQTPA